MERKRQNMLSIHDVEKQNTEGSITAPEDAAQLNALKALFGLSDAQVKKWPSALAYTQHIQDQHLIHLMVVEFDEILWDTIGVARPKMLWQCWQWFAAVANTIHTLEDEETSIEDIYDGLQALSTSGERPKPSPVQKNACLVAVFAVLCWGTMILQPIISRHDFNRNKHGLFIQHESPQSYGLKIDIVRRPISAIFRNFQRSMTSSRWQHPIGVDTSDRVSAELFVSTLNYSSLNVIGKIRLRWVDSIVYHLDFDQRTRTLSVFRFPTFCALSTLAESRGPVFEGLTRGLFGADSMKENDSNKQLNQEVLMSYRVLFGQTRAARAGVKKSLRILKEETGATYDPLLELVCGQPKDKVINDLPSSLWPVSCRDFDESLQEDASYSSRDDFPLFGQRLEKLQQFNLRQQPSRLRDLWRDRRNPLQWYTFWVVTIVGGLSLVMSFLQLLVAIAQLAVSIKFPSGS